MIRNAPRYQSQVIEEEAIQELAFDYEQQGYEVVISPSNTQLPGFLHGFRPDLIALKPNDSIVVEVKIPGKTSAKNDQLQAVREAIRQQPGWRLRVIVNNAPLKPDSLSSQEINGLLLQSELLERENIFPASLLIAWSATEAAMRLSVNKENIKVPDFDIRTLIARLYSDGILEREDYDLLVRYLRARNLVAHGYRKHSDSTETDITELEPLRKIARRLLLE